MPPTRVAIAGLGAIGRALARRLADGLPGLVLACAATRDQVKAAPEYQEGKPIVILGALGKLEPLPFE